MRVLTTVDSERPGRRPHCLRRVFAVSDNQITGDTMATIETCAQQR